MPHLVPRVLYEKVSEFPEHRLFKRVIILFLFVLLPIAASAEESVLNILYTGAIKGELEPCGCSPKTEAGGLARLSGYISAERENLAPYIIVDAGSSMGDDSTQGRLKADALLQSFGIIGYDALNLLQEHTLPPEGFLSPLAAKYKVPALFNGSPDVTVQRGPVRVNISTDPKKFMEGMLNVLLTGLPVAQAPVNGWDVVVTSSGEVLDEPRVVAGRVAVSGYPKGRKLGILTLVLDGNGKVTSTRHRWRTLDKEVAEDKRVRTVLDGYDAKVAALVKDEERKVLAEGPYRGVASCVECHGPFVDKWKTTRHSGAFGSLEKAGKSKDPECVKCHTTGYAEEGFYTMTTTPGLANVQCEACHGPGREHSIDSSIPMRAVGETVCIKCHTKDNSPDFNFNQYLEKIRH